MTHAGPASTLPGTTADRPVLLDGGLATRLETLGHDLSGRLWSAGLLLSDPDAIRRAHRDFFTAGAEVATTASYQVSYEGLAEAGLDRRQADALLARSVEVARRAASETGRRAWVAASVGPYGAMLADGSEYRGDYGLSVPALRAWHRPRLAALAEAGPDVLALETVPCLAEAEALLTEVAGAGLGCWLSLSADGDRTRLGEPLAEAFAMAAEVGEVFAVGVNCCSPRGLADVVAQAAAVAGKPAVAYPNSGEVWDAHRRAWAGPAAFASGEVAGWVAAGARLVGGCCRVGPDQIAAMRRTLDRRARGGG